ncbi:MAG TPA: HEAT repeat domain-containing protein, partial [Thermoanaerobaculia bacterium]|nr:HEAT repeat domain-containing protein [Thermoanaerobaculia bacterium]
FDFVTSLGPVIVVEIKPFFTDHRWFVVRNMIALVRSINDRTLIPDVRKCAAHPDLRVRLEAIKTLLALEPTPPKGLLEDAIGDPDPKLAEKAIILVGNYGIKEAVDPLLQIVAGNDVWGARRPLRLRALHALGELAEPRALSQLQRFFTDSFLPWPAREERRAAYESLAGYPSELRAPIVQRGLRSRDAYVRQVCEKIANG